LVFVRETNHVTNFNFRDISGLDTLAASKGLRKLHQAGLLDKRGKGAQTFYVAGPKMLEAIEADEKSRLHDNGASLPDKEASLHGKDGAPDAKLPQELKSRLLHHRLGKRADPDAVRGMIVDVCHHGAFSKDEIARLLAREPSHIAQHYLSPLLKEGAIVLTIPDTPNHPRAPKKPKAQQSEKREPEGSNGGRIGWR
jgi:ATP-dependent DNA helicase RecG